MRVQPPRSIRIAFLIILASTTLVLPLTAYAQDTTSSPEVHTAESGLPPGLPAEYETVTVTEIVDGDKFKVELDGRTHEVNLIGADAPEPEECYFLVSRKFLMNQIPVGSTIYLERDKKDKDGKKRLLRYAWFPNVKTGEAELLNVRVIRYGYAGWVSKNGNTRYDDQMEIALAKAQDPKHGLWLECVAFHSKEWVFACLDVPKATVDAITAHFTEQFKPRRWQAVLSRQNDQYPYIVAAMGAVSMMSDASTPDFAVWAVNNLENPTRIISADIMAGAFSDFEDGSMQSPPLNESTLGVTEALACTGYVEPTEDE